MITKNECISMLMSLEKTGLKVDDQIRKVLTSKNVPIETLQFINNNQGLEAIKFYEMIRKNHNQKKSRLYTNLLSGEHSEEELVTTLTSFLQQIALYSRKLRDSDKILFLKEIRAEEVSRVLHQYFKDGNYETCNNMLGAIKCDLLVLEGISGRREFNN